MNRRILIVFGMLFLFGALAPVVSAADGNGFLQIWRNKTTDATLPSVPLIVECWGDVSWVDNNGNWNMLEDLENGNFYKFDLVYFIDMSPGNLNRLPDEFFSFWRFLK